MFKNEIECCVNKIQDIIVSDNEMTNDLFSEINILRKQEASQFIIDQIHLSLEKEINSFDCNNICLDINELRELEEDIDL
jgi:hypothetical protein